MKVTEKNNNNFITTTISVASNIRENNLLYRGKEEIYSEIKS